MAKVKDGKQTSELWYALGATLVGLAAALGLIQPEEMPELEGLISQIVGGALAVAATVTYIVNRWKVKAANGK